MEQTEDDPFQKVIGSKKSRNNREKYASQTNDDEDDDDFERLLGAGNDEDDDRVHEDSDSHMYKSNGEGQKSHEEHNNANAWDDDYENNHVPEPLSINDLSEKQESP